MSEYNDLYAQEYDRKLCKVFYCDNLLKKQCCFYCKRERRWKNKCLNTPAKCGLQDTREK